MTNMQRLVWLQKTLQFSGISRARISGQFAGVDSIVLGDRHRSCHGWGMEAEFVGPAQVCGRGCCPILVPRTRLPNTQSQPCSAEPKSALVQKT